MFVQRGGVVCQCASPMLPILLSSLLFPFSLLSSSLCLVPSFLLAINSLAVFSLLCTFLSLIGVLFSSFVKEREKRRKMGGGCERGRGREKD